MFYCPTRIVFAPGAMNKADFYLASLGKRALIVSGKQSAKLSGALDDALAVLKKLGMSATIYDAISENPSLESIVAGKEILLSENCNLVIGIGGGSPIDAAPTPNEFIMSVATTAVDTRWKYTKKYTRARITNTTQRYFITLFILF